MKKLEIKINPNNPRTITDEKYQKLLSSIREFPKMMELRPIIYDPKTGYILAGNMRFKACQDLGYSELPEKWIRSAEGLTDKEKERFIIDDNVGFGEWDWEILANEWDEQKLSEWALDVPEYHDFSEKNREIDIDEISDEMIIKLKYSEEDYWKVKEQLSKIASTPEQAVYKLLGNE